VTKADALNGPGAIGGERRLCQRLRAASGSAISSGRLDQVWEVTRL
jgi:hypothetical protein